MGNDEKKQNVEIMNQPNSVNYGKLAFHYLIYNVMYLFLVPLITIAFAHLSVKDLEHLFNRLHELDLISVTLVTATTVFLAALYLMSRPRQVYLLDFACMKSDPSQMCIKEYFIKRSELTGRFSEESLAFQKKITERSGYGQKTYGSKMLMEVPGTISVEEARKEAAMLMFGAIDQLLEKTKIKVKDIGILVVNCSAFTPTPSLSAMVVNQYNSEGIF